VDSAPTSPRTHQVTRLLGSLDAGDPAALEQLIGLIYEELHEIAERQMRGERPDHTLQPTLLVNEAFLRLTASNSFTWQNRAQFFGVAAQAMRRILVDHSRRRRTQKRGGAEQRVPLDVNLVGGASEMDYEDLNEALNRLAELDQRQARIVELRYFGGLTIEEVAEVMAIAPSTVKRPTNSSISAPPAWPSTPCRRVSTSPGTARPRR
jgi:RNA polymerase sigma-70 factor (ECF subfamily)